jgi:hypothetical protein
MNFYRIVKTDRPTLEDLTSGAALGRPLAAETPEALRLHTGISVFATARQAADHARQWPRLGSFIATIEVGAGDQSWSSAQPAGVAITRCGPRLPS